MTCLKLLILLCSSHSRLLDPVCAWANDCSLKLLMNFWTLLIGTTSWQIATLGSKSKGPEPCLNALTVSVLLPILWYELMHVHMRQSMLRGCSHHQCSGQHWTQNSPNTNWWKSEHGNAVCPFNIFNIILYSDGKSVCGGVEGRQMKE